MTKTITTATPVSARAKRACAMFGVQIASAHRRTVESLRPSVLAAATIDQTLRPAQIALITGPSGSGKSTTLRALAHRLDRRGRFRVLAETQRLKDDPRPIIDLFHLPITRALRQLSSAGLADATLIPLSARELSDGQLARLSLAIAMAAAAAHVKRHNSLCTMLNDEFTTILDTSTAVCIAASTSRWIAQNPLIRLVCATARDDLIESLAPDMLVYQPLSGPPRIHTRPVRE